jgi:hypothetical protein
VYDAKLVEAEDRSNCAWVLTKRGRDVLSVRFGTVFPENKDEQYTRFVSARYGGDLLRITKSVGEKGLILLGAKTASLLGAVVARLVFAGSSADEQLVQDLLSIARQDGMTDDNYATEENRDRIDSYIKTHSAADNSKENEEETVKTIINLTRLEQDVVEEAMSDKDVQKLVERRLPFGNSDTVTLADLYITAIREVMPELFDVQTDPKYRVGQVVSFEGQSRLVDSAYLENGSVFYKLAGVGNRVAETDLAESGVPILLKPDWLNPDLDRQWFVAYERAKIDGTLNYGAIMGMVEEYASNKGIPVRVDGK